MYNRSIEELGRGGRVESILDLLSLLVNAKFLTVTGARTGDREKKLFATADVVRGERDMT
jgi:hypothetical protein